MRNIPSRLATAGKTRIRTEAPQATQKVTVTPVQTTTHLLADEAEWTWENLRDYVMAEIEKRHGPQVSDPVRVKATFQGFLKRWGADAVVIAKAAFEIYDGMWANAPITYTRFCKKSDDFFARRILDRIER